MKLNQAIGNKIITNSCYYGDAVWSNKISSLNYLNLIRYSLTMYDK